MGAKYIYTFFIKKILFLNFIPNAITILWYIIL